jgi:hypothetical protein
MKDVIGISEPWNAGFIEPEREMVPRDYLWASELGNAPIDIFLRLKATAPSNPPNDRAKRKMSAGVKWEFVIEQILKSAGILLETQQRCEHQYPGMLKVTGKMDFLIGGKCDEASAQAYLDAGDLYIDKFTKQAALNIIKYYAKEYPDGFEPRPVEFKSISDYAMDDMEVTEKPIERNVIQLFHYLISGDYPIGTLSYMNRNDCRMMEFPIVKSPEIEERYKAKIALVSKYVLAGEMPPKEPLIIFDEIAGKFSKNLNVSWSNYLTMLYSFKEPREYDEPYGKKAENWNRVMARVRDGAKMTDKNNAILAEIAAEGFVVEDIKSKFRAKPETEEAV